MCNSEVARMLLDLWDWGLNSKVSEKKTEAWALTLYN